MFFSFTFTIIIFILLFIYLIFTEYLLNRLQYVDFDEFLTGINLPPPFAHPPPPALQKKVY